MDHKEIYVCSYGGSGSWLLVNALKPCSVSYHIHTRKPPFVLTKPEKIEYKIEQEAGAKFPELTYTYDEQFGDEVNDNPDAHVVFVYSTPEHSINSSQSFSKGHFKNIQVPNIDSIPETREKYHKQNKDYIKYEEFFDNYVVNEKQYKVICVNYHKMWENQHTLFQLLGAEDCKLPEKRATTSYKPMPVYDSFRARMDVLDPVFVV